MNLYEILIPIANKNGKEFKVKHHREFDEYARKLTGGLTILRMIKGQWVSKEGDVLEETMIPVRVVCDKTKIDEIIQFALNHYDQHCILSYLLSQDAKFHYNTKILNERK